MPVRVRRPDLNRHPFDNIPDEQLPTWTPAQSMMDAMNNAMYAPVPMPPMQGPPSPPALREQLGLGPDTSVLGPIPMGPMQGPPNPAALQEQIKMQEYMDMAAVENQLRYPQLPASSPSANSMLSAMNQSTGLLGGPNAELKPAPQQSFGQKVENFLTPQGFTDSLKSVFTPQGEVYQNINAGGQAIGLGMAESLGINDFADAVARKSDPTYVPGSTEAAIRQDIEDEIGKTAAGALDFTGNVIGLAAPTGGAYRTGGVFMGKVGERLLTKAPSWAQRFGTSALTGAGTGAVLGTGQELLQEAGNPDAQSFGEHMADIGKNTAYFAAYGGANPVAQRVMQGIGNRLPGAARNALGALETRAPLTANVGRGLAEGALTGGMVGMGMGTLEALKTGEPSQLLPTAWGETTDEIKENFVQSLAFGLVSRLSGRGIGPLSPAMSSPEVAAQHDEAVQAVQQKVFDQLSDVDRADLNQWVQEAVSQGMPEPEAKIAALDQIANTSEGQQFIDKALDDVVDAHVAKTVAQAPAAISTEGVQAQQTEITSPVADISTPEIPAATPEIDAQSPAATFGAEQTKSEAPPAAKSPELGDIVTLRTNGDQPFTVIADMGKGAFKMQTEDGTQITMNKAGITGYVGRSNLSEDDKARLEIQQTYDQMRQTLTTNSGGWKNSTKVKHLQSMKTFAEQNGLEFRPRHQELLDRFTSEAEADKTRQRKEENESWVDAAKRLTPNELFAELNGLSTEQLRELRDQEGFDKGGNLKQSALARYVHNQLMQKAQANEMQTQQEPGWMGRKQYQEIADLDTGDMVGFWRQGVRYEGTVERKEKNRFIVNYQTSTAGEVRTTNLKETEINSVLNRYYESDIQAAAKQWTDGVTKAQLTTTLDSKHSIADLKSLLFKLQVPKAEYSSMKNKTELVNFAADKLFELSQNVDPAVIEQGLRDAGIHTQQMHQEKQAEDASTVDWSKVAKESSREELVNELNQLDETELRAVAQEFSGHSHIKKKNDLVQFTAHHLRRIADLEKTPGVGNTPINEDKLLEKLAGQLDGEQFTYVRQELEGYRKGLSPRRVDRIAATPVDGVFTVHTTDINTHNEDFVTLWSEDTGPQGNRVDLEANWAKADLKTLVSFHWKGRELVGPPDYTGLTGYEKTLEQRKQKTEEAFDKAKAERERETASAASSDIQRRETTLEQQKQNAENPVVNQPEVDDTGSNETEGVTANANAEPVRTDGAESLETTPSEDVSGTREVRPADANASESPAASGNGTRPSESATDGETSVTGGLSTESGTLPMDSRNGVGTGEGADSSANGGRRTGSGGGTAAVQRPKQPEQRAERGRDFVITTELDDLGGARTKFKGNVAALKLIQELEQSGRMANAEEQAQLARYVGWGGLAQAFDDRNKDWQKEYAELRRLVDDGVITQSEYETMRQTTQYAHYTSKEIVDSMYSALTRMGFTGGRVLEPSMGTGNFFGLMPHAMTANSTRTGVEMDAVTGKIAKHLYPNANVQIKPFQDYKVADGYFDAAIGNPPFSGEVKLPYGKGKQKRMLELHNYFFMQTLDKVRDGGIVAFVTSSGSLNARTNADKRRMMADKANFLGAIRLPGDAFKKNAGTEVTTDIIFLQKRAEGEPAKHAADFIDTYKMTAEKDGKTAEVDNNVYFHDHPEMVLGAYTVDRLTGNRLGVKSDGRDLNLELAKAVLELPQNIFTDRKTAVQEEPVFADHSFTHINELDEGGYAVDGGKLLQRNGDQMVQPQLDGKKAERVRAMIPVRDAARNVLRLMNQGAPDAQLKAAQQELNGLYDTFYKRFGYLNDSSNVGAFKGDSIGTGLLMSLEKEVKQDDKKAKPKYQKEAIFSERIFHPAKKTEKVDNAEEALVVSLFEQGKLDFSRMGELTGKDRNTLIQDLAGKIYLNPLNGEWETQDSYLSGNVRVKLLQAQDAAARDPQYAANVKALEAAQPVDLEPHEISAKLGSSWIPTEDLQAFIQEFLDAPADSVRIFYNAHLHQYNVDAGALASNTKNTDEYGVQHPRARDKRATDLIEDSLNLRHTMIQWTEKVGDSTRTFTDDAATAEAQMKQKQIQQIFRDWIWDDEARTQRLAQKYNWEFNNTRLREYDGELIYGSADSLTKLPGSTVSLRKHQRNAVWRTVQGGNTLLAHVVGSGKTYTMIHSAMEMKRLGLIQKPVFVVPNHLLDQWMKDFKSAYPASNVLKLSSDDIPAVTTRRGKVAVTDTQGKPVYEMGRDGKPLTTKDGRPIRVMRDMTNTEFKDKLDLHRSNRAAALSKIAVGKYDAVLITHKTFEKLPMSPDSVQAHIREQIEDVTEAIRGAQEDGTNQRTVKQLERIKESLQAKMKANIDEETKDVAIPFEELGMDQLFVDEAHMFKNLKFHTKMRNVSSLPQTASKRAEDMYLKSQYLTKLRNGRGVVFATGTPIANAVAEMFTIQRYLMMDRLREMGLAHFDAWAATFGETISDFESNPAGQYKQKTRFSQYQNVPELMQLFRDVADIQTADMLDLPTPDHVVRDTITVPMSPEQKVYMQEIQARAEGMKNADPKDDNWLKLTSDARKMALEIRLVRPDIKKGFEDSKIVAAVGKMVEIYKNPELAKTKDGKPVDRHVQIVFLDMGTPKKTDVSDEEEKPKTDDPESAENVSVYQDIKMQLVNRGIPAGEIAFIHEANTDKRKEVLFQKVRDGEIRFLFGSTEKMGAGMNAQDRLVALHHIDAPWRPADLEQREGRIIRQGNLNNTVYVYSYTTKGSFDQLMWEALKRKAKMIAQVMNGTAASRTLEEVEAMVIRYAEVAAVTSDNPLIAEKFKVDKEVNDLQMLKSQHERTISKLKQEIAQIPDRIQSRQRLIATTTADIKRAQSVPEADRILIADGVRYEQREETAVPEGETKPKQPSYRELAGQKIIDLANRAADRMNYRETDKLGTFGGFDVMFQKGVGPYLKGETNHNFDINYESPIGTYSRLQHAFTNILEATTGSFEREIEYYKKRIEEIKPLAERKFEKETQLRDAAQRQFEIQRQLITLNQEHDQAVTDTGEEEDGGGDYALAATPVSGFNRKASTKTGRASNQSPAQSLIEDTLNKLSPRAGKDAADLVAKHLNVVVSRDFVRRSAEGVYNYRNSGAVRVRGRSYYDWRVVGHELGHVFSHQIQRVGDKRELVAIAKALYPGKLPDKKLQEEGFAEFFRLWVADPQLAMKNAPLTTQLFENFIERDLTLKNLFAKVRTIVDNDLGNTALGRALAGNITDRVTENSGPLNYKPGWVRKILFHTLDYSIPAKALMQKARELAEEQGKDLSAMVDLAKLVAVVGDADQKAWAAFTAPVRDSKGRFLEGRSLQSIYKAGVNEIAKALDYKGMELNGETKGAEDIFSAILIANRLEERYERGFTKLPMTFEDAEEILTMAETRWPEALKHAKDYAETYSRVMLDLLENQDMLTPAARRTIERGSTQYIPIIYDEKAPNATGTKSAARTYHNPVKRFKGEVAPVLNAFQASMLRLSEIQAAVEYKRVIDAIQSLSQIKGMGPFVQQVPNPVKAVRISTDQIVENIIDKLDEDVDISGILEDRAMTFFQPGGLASIDPRKPVIMNIRKGNATYLELAPDVFKMLLGLKPIQINMVGRALTHFSRLNRAAALFTGRYITNAVVRDFNTTLIQSKVPLHTLAKHVGTSALVAGGWSKDAEAQYAAFVQSGAFNGAAENMLRGMIRYQFEESLVQTAAPGWKKLSLKSGKKVLVKTVHTPADIIKFFEEMPRVNEFLGVFKQEMTTLGQDGDAMWKLYVEKGTDALPLNVQRQMERILVDAAYAASEVTTNFRLRGVSSFMRNYVPTVSFLHGSLQGTYRLARQVKNKPGKTLLYTTAYLGLLSAISWAFMNADDDDKKLYQDMDSTARDKYWWMPNPFLKGTYVAFAKPFEYAIVANLAERFLDYSLSGEKNARTPAADLGSLAANMQVMPTILLTLMQMNYNESSFGTPIVTQSEQNRAKEMQFGPNTSLSARGISAGTAPTFRKVAELFGHITGDPKVGVSPKMIDYFVKQNFGLWGSLGLDVSDSLSRLVQTGSTSEAAKTFKQTEGVEYTPLLGQLVYGQAEGSSRIVSKFYEDYKTAQTLSASAVQWQKDVKQGISQKRYTKLEDVPLPSWVNEETLKLMANLPAMTNIYKNMRDGSNDLQVKISDPKTDPATRRQLTLQRDYIEKLGAGLIYRVTPAKPHADALITDAQAERFRTYFISEAEKALAKERETKGGVSQEIADLTSVWNKKKR